jgi:hypothetical protein
MNYLSVMKPEPVKTAAQLSPPRMIATKHFLSVVSVFALACGTPDEPDEMAMGQELSVQAIPEGQAFSDQLEVLLVSSLPAKIFYSTDGTQPSANSSSAIPYTGPITLTEQTLLSFVAVEEDGSWSRSQEELYIKNDTRPPPSPAPRMLDMTAQTLFFEGQPGSSDPVYKTVALRSIGTQAVNIISIRLQSNPNESIFYDPDAFDITSEIPTGSLAPGESIIIEIMYIPSETLRSDVLRISSNEQRNGGQQQIELWGRIADW